MGTRVALPSNARQAKRVENARFTCRDKSILPISYVMTSLSQESESADSVLVFLDMTRQHNMQREVRKSEERYRAVVERAREIIFSLTPEATISSLNPAFDAATIWMSPDFLCFM